MHVCVHIFARVGKRGRSSSPSGGGGKASASGGAAAAAKSSRRAASADATDPARKQTAASPTSRKGVSQGSKRVQPPEPHAAASCPQAAASAALEAYHRGAGKILSLRGTVNIAKLYAKRYLKSIPEEERPTHECRETLRLKDIQAHDIQRFKALEHSFSKYATAVQV